MSWIKTIKNFIFMRENTEQEQRLFEAMNDLYNEFMAENEIGMGMQPYLTKYKVPLANYVAKALIELEYVSRRKDGRKWCISWQSNKRPTPQMAQDIYEFAKSIKNGEKESRKPNVTGATVEEVQEGMKRVSDALRPPSLIDAHEEIERLNKRIEDIMGTNRHLHEVEAELLGRWKAEKSEKETLEREINSYKKEIRDMNAKRDIKIEHLEKRCLELERVVDIERGNCRTAEAVADQYGSDYNKLIDRYDKLKRAHELIAGII